MELKVIHWGFEANGGPKDWANWFLKGIIWVTKLPISVFKTKAKLILVYEMHFEFFKEYPLIQDVHWFSDLTHVAQNALEEHGWHLPVYWPLISSRKCPSTQLVQDEGDVQAEQL